MRNSIASLFIAAALWVVVGNANAQQGKYPSDFNVALEQGGDLWQALPPKFGNQLASPPLASQPQNIPQITPITSTDDNKVLRQVSISKGFINLVNHLSHAKAVDRVRPGYFDQYVQNLTRVAGDNFDVQPPVIEDACFWKDDVMNDQASCFNQMIGLMVAINFSHHYLGHFEKYAPKMAGPGNTTVPINDLLSPAEWEASVKFGATDALTCALRAEGAMALFDAIDKMPRRPAWTEVIVPKNIDLKQLNKELLEYQNEFDKGGLKFSMLDKFQFRPAWDQPSLMGLAQKTFDGGPAFLTIIQRPMIDIHADELIGQVPAHVPGVL